MTDALPEMPFLRNIGLLMTCKCQVTCPHCIIQAGPHRTEEVNLHDALSWIKSASSYRNGYIKVLSLTGGEPFYNLEHFKQICAYGALHGMFVSAVTNAYWASSMEEAVQILRQNTGLRMISVSTDVYHQMYIPFERVRNAVAAARDCGVLCSVAICTENEDDPGYKRILDEVYQLLPQEQVFTALTFAAGRALKRLDSSKYPLTTEVPVSACAAGSSPIILPDGRVIACIGPVIDLQSSHPLVLGDLKEHPLHDILDRAELNPILHTIRVWGPRKLIQMISDAGLGEHLPTRYIRNSMCNACYSLMSNPKIVRFLDQLASEPEFARRVAYARVFYQGETRMAELMGLRDEQASAREKVA
jgi:MoaA/NifB/PqqE/SkfB family radical SAM enzyme